MAQFLDRYRYLEGKPNEIKAGTAGFRLPIAPSITREGGASMSSGTNPIQALMQLLQGAGGGAPPAPDPRIAAMQQMRRGGGGPFPQNLQPNVPPSGPEEYPGGPTPGSVRVPRNYSEEADQTPAEATRSNPINRPMHPGDEQTNYDMDPREQANGQTSEQDLQDVYDTMDQDAGDNVSNDGLTGNLDKDQAIYKQHLEDSEEDSIRDKFIKLHGEENIPEL